MLIENCSEKEYFAHSAINSSLLKLLVQKTPADFRHAHMDGHNLTTPSTEFGSAVHMAILEPEKFLDTYCVYESVKRGKAWETFKAEHNNKIV